MSKLLWLAGNLVAAPTPTPTADPANTFYSPGTIGFLFTFIMVAGAILLIFDMVRRVRRVRYRAEIQEKLAAEDAAAATAKPAAAKPVAKAAPKAAPQARKKPDRPEPPAKPKR